MTAARFLVDTSALVRLLRSQSARAPWESSITAGTISVCPITELEILYSARSKADREELTRQIRTAFAWEPMPDRVFERASEVQALLTAEGLHRSASAVDLLVAATAELRSVGLIHYDHDFEDIARVTQQPALWLAEPGTLD